MSKVRDRICGIYFILNTFNGKGYIGQSHDILNRFICHKCSLKHNRHHNHYLQQSFNKYGEDRFVFKILEKCSQEHLDEREIFWIDHFHSNNPLHGYNADSGGNAQKVVSHETRKLISERVSRAQTGRKLTEEWKDNIRRSRIGTKRSDETKRRLSERKKGVSNINSGNFQKGFIPWNKGMTPSESTRAKISQALQTYYSQFKVKPTPEMIQDVENGMSRRKFEAKYGGHQSLWRELYHKGVS